MKFPIVSDSIICSYPLSATIPLQSFNKELIIPSGSDRPTQQYIRNNCRNQSFTMEDGEKIYEILVLVVCGVLICLSAKFISDGIELMLEVFSPEFVGGFFVPFLAAVPDVAIILASGFDPTDDLQEQITIGIGMQLGTTILLLTFAWGLTLHHAIEVHGELTIPRSLEKQLRLTVTPCLAYLPLMVLGFCRSFSIDLSSEAQQILLLSAFLLCAFFVILFLVYSWRQLHQRIPEYSELFDLESPDVTLPSGKRRKILVRSIVYISTGLLFVVLSSNMVIDTIERVRSDFQWSSFRISYTIMPLFANAAEIASSVLLVRKDSRRYVDTALSQILSSVAINNSLVLGCTLWIMVYRGLAWTFFLEVLVSVFCALTTVIYVYFRPRQTSSAIRWYLPWYFGTSLAMLYL